MQIVIDIPQNVYDMLQRFPDDQLHIENAIKYGVPFNSVIEDIKAEIGARAFDITPKGKCGYFDGIDDVMDIVDKVIEKHISGKE